MSYRFNIGEKVGRWKVICNADTKTYIRKYNGHTKTYNIPHYICVCECGTKRIVSANSLGYRSTSCGCFARENSSNIHKTHGLSKTRLFNIWRGIKKRCYSKNKDNYKFYGGRGIEMDKYWKEDFTNFAKWAGENDYADDKFIDRIDNNGNYEPSNCRFINNEEQQHNKRNNYNMTAFQETKTLEEWARDDRCLVSTTTIKRRILWGIKPELAITSPSRTVRSKLRKDTH
jgi:hypothetical protein